MFSWLDAYVVEVNYAYHTFFTLYTRFNNLFIITVETTFGSMTHDIPQECKQEQSHGQYEKNKSCMP